MRAEALSISISENMEPYIYTMSDGKSIAEKANIYMVIGMYSAKVISLEKAAE